MTGGEEPADPGDTKENPCDTYGQKGFSHSAGDIHSKTLPGTDRRPEGNSRYAQTVFTQVQKRSDADKGKDIDPDVWRKPACFVGHKGKNDPR